MKTTRICLDDARFNKTFRLPADPASGHPRTTHLIKYADYGFRNAENPAEETIFLFFGPLMGSRLAHAAKDALAKRYKIRILHPDRPGFGGSDPVAAQHRMKVWRQVIPALLEHLAIPYVHLGCHSGGLIYALDLLRHRPDVVHPRRPYLAVGCPWILPCHTKSTLLSVVGILPTGLLRQTDKFAKLINFYVGPAVGTAFRACEKITRATKVSANARAEEAAVVDGEQQSDEEGLEAALEPEIINRMYAQGIDGVSCDAVLFMHKVGWSDWGDYDGLAPCLVETLRAAGKRLVMGVYYAESDGMIGEAARKYKGPAWFDECWGLRKYGDVVDYRTRVVRDADHDDVWDLKHGTMESVFASIFRMSEEHGTVVGTVIK